MKAPPKQLARFMTKASDLVTCLEEEGVEYIFAVRARRISLSWTVSRDRPGSS
jgi:hypothetical protein